MSKDAVVLGLDKPSPPVFHIHKRTSRTTTKRLFVIQIRHC